MNKGLSGCSLNLLDENTIRKTSTDSNYVGRLKKQIDKQVLFEKIYSESNIKTPKVKRIGDNYFDMEYIPSSSFESFFSIASKDDLDNFYLNLKDYLKVSSQYKKQKCNDLLIEKINTLKKKSNHGKFLEYISSLLENEDLFLPIGFCHGDLTLSNILFKKGKYYFIDFLDSHIETPYYDLSKLKQDLFYKWAIKVNNFTNLKVSQGLDYIWNLLYNDYREDLDSMEFQVIDALTLLRIEPYAKEDVVKIVLNDCITKLKLHEKFVIANSR